MRTHTQASVPLGNTSHFPPFKQVSLGWEHRRPGEGQEQKSASAASKRAHSKGHRLEGRLCRIMGLMGAGGPRNPCKNPKGFNSLPRMLKWGGRGNRLARCQVHRSCSKWGEVA